MPIYASTWGPVAAGLAYVRKMAWVDIGGGNFFNPNSPQNPNLLTANIISQLSGAPAGQRVLFLWFYGSGLYSHASDAGLPWADAAAAAIQTNFASLLALLVAAGVQIDAIVIDNEEAGQFSTFQITAPKKAAIIADPRGASWGDGTNTQLWNRKNLETQAALLRTALVGPRNTYYPAATISNYGGATTNSSNQVPDKNGYTFYADSTVGLPAPDMYGENNSSGYPLTPFGGLCLDVARAVACRLTAPSSKLQPWLTPQADPAQLKARLCQLVMLGTDRVLFFNPSPGAPDDGVYLNTVLTEINDTVLSLGAYTPNSAPSKPVPSTTQLANFVTFSVGSRIVSRVTSASSDVWQGLSVSSLPSIQTVLDKKITAKALAAIKKYGLTATLRQPGSVGVQLDMLSGVQSTKYAETTVYSTPPVAYSTQFVNGDTIFASDAYVLISPEGVSTEPLPGCQLVIGSTTWNVISVKIHSPGRTIAAYELQIRKSA